MGQAVFKSQVLCLLVGRWHLFKRPSGRCQELCFGDCRCRWRWKKELIALIDGFRESKESWKELLLDLKQRGLTQGAIGRG